MKPHVALGVALASVVLVSGCASAISGHTAYESEAPHVQPTSMVPTSRSGALKVPTLVVRVECTSCEVRPEVPKAIRESYVQAAAKAGADVADDFEATLTIKTYSDRGILRFLGPLSMTRSDEIKASVRSGGREFSIEQSARVPFRGIEAVAKRIGEAAFESLAKAQSTAVLGR